MAAPPTRTLKDLSGKWVMNKSLSDSPEPALALQGIAWLTRKAVGLATVTLHVNQYVAPPSPPSEAAEPVTHVEIDQTATGGIKGTTEKRCLDHEWREHADYLFGRLKGRSKWLAAGAIDDAFLAKGWLEGEEEKAGPDGETHIWSYVESQDSGWTATQVWGFQIVGSERRYCRHIVVAKGAEKVQFRLVYDLVN